MLKQKVLAEAEAFSAGAYFLSTRSMFEGVEADPDKYPEIHKIIIKYPMRVAKGLVTRILLDSGRWDKWNCGSGNNGTWSVLSRAGPIGSGVLTEIERIRGDRPGISISTLLEHTRNQEYPFLTALEEEGKTRFKAIVAKTLRQAGYVRRSTRSTYFVAPGAIE